MLNKQQIKVLSLMYTEAKEKAFRNKSNIKEHEYLGYSRAILDIALLLNGGDTEDMRKQLYIPELKFEKPE